MTYLFNCQDKNQDNHTQVKSNLHKRVGNNPSPEPPTANRKLPRKHVGMLEGVCICVSYALPLKQDMDFMFCVWWLFYLAFFFKKKRKFPFSVKR